MQDSRVYIVDDDRSYGTGVRRLLHAAGIEAQAFDSGAAFLAEVPADARGCVVADLRMPGLGGLELQDVLASTGRPLPIVFLSGHADIPSTVSAMRKGAVDFIEKCAPGEVLINAVQHALACDAALQADRKRQHELQARFATLTPREREVLACVVRGLMNKQIAAELGIHERTVKLHRTAITTKVGVHSTAELAILTNEARLLGNSRVGVDPPQYLP
jgi:FixJ family two-component response regulator